MVCKSNSVNRYFRASDREIYLYNIKFSGNTNYRGSTCTCTYCRTTAERVCLIQV